MRNKGVPHEAPGPAKKRKCKSKTEIHNFGKENKMSNTSNAYGTIELVGDWDNKMCDALNMVKREWELWYYSICVKGRFAPNRKSLPFDAIGRWTFSSSLGRLKNWIEAGLDENPEFATAYAELTHEMELRQCRIDFDYTDEERGTRVLYEGRASFFSANGSFLIICGGDNLGDYYSMADGSQPAENINLHCMECEPLIIPVF
jgi:hypothetical protein